MTTFQKATKYTAKLRLAMVGTSGSGKTYSALAIASGLVPNGRIALIDTERGSASLYADLFPFDTLALEDHAPQTFVNAIHAAESEGYDAIIIDSLSHAWSGRGGALEMVDKAQKRSQSVNSFTAWRDVTPHHNRLIDAMVSSKAHVIATMRSKTEYVIEENAQGKKVPKRIGMEAVQRSGIEYEFTLVGDIDLAHTLAVTKSRCPELADAIIEKPGAAMGKTLAAWLGTGAAPVAASGEDAGTLTAFMAAISSASTHAELVAVAASPQRPAKTSPHYDAAIAAYNQRKSELEAAS
jgi:hypothetical protein